MAWFIRKSDGSIFGPVEQTTLATWAADGRIMPDDQVSEDQATWSSAADMSGLQMNWHVELDDGRLFGPVHAATLLDFLADGSITSKSSIRHRQTGERTTLAAMIESSGSDADVAREARRWQVEYREEVDKEEHRLAEQEKVFQDRIHFLEVELTRERAAAEDARKRLITIEDEHRDVVRQLRDLNERYIRLRDKSQSASVEPNAQGKLRA